MSTLMTAMIPILQTKKWRLGNAQQATPRLLTVSLMFPKKVVKEDRPRSVSAYFLVKIRKSWFMSKDEHQISRDIL